MDKVFGSDGYRACDGVPDMTVLSDINVAAINENLLTRYNHDRIYTYSGTILIAVNPYKELEIYTQESVQRYKGRKLMEEEPHVFALAESSLRALQNCEKNQSCVISGESGAGKTETTKFLLQYLCSVTTGVSTWVEQQILEANTILEAFGNAKTVRNDNSSRFGKFMQVCFDRDWHIKGCVMQDYLLEQSRITFQGPSERNYHVFYQLVVGAHQNKELAEQFHIGDPNGYAYLNKSGCSKIDGIDDAYKFDSLRLAFNILHIPQEICDGIFGTLSAILWLGNMVFTDVDGEKCELSKEDRKIVDTVANLLGLIPEDLEETVLQRQINIRGTVTHIPFKISEAQENRHAMAKALYSRTFAWLVEHINNCTNPGQDQTRFLGVLDIFGFENFATNSFEQLCINYTNEKLHRFFNHYVFALEQEIYQQEGLKFCQVTFTDNTDCLELLERPPRCILKLISEECRMPKGSDKSYLTKLHQEFESHSNYVKGEDRRKWETEFGIKHYAGCVIYTVCGFVDKNRDAQQDVFFDLMSKSKNNFVSELTKFQDLLGCTIARMGAITSTISRGSTKGKPTVSDAFRNQLQALVDVLQASNPWYVRCIKPNHNKAANCYDQQLVLDQLRYLGMNDIIRIRREGFPVHLNFEDFIRRYYCLWHRRRFKDIKMHVTDLMKEQRLPSKDWQVGKSKVFMRQKVYEVVEDRRQSKTNKSALLIQKTYRMFHQRAVYMRKKEAAILIQAKYRSTRQRCAFVKKRKAAVIVQSFVRGMFAREVANALREMKRMEEEERRRDKLEEERRLQEEEAKRAAEDEEEKMKILQEAENDSLEAKIIGDSQQFEKQLETLTDMVQNVNPRMIAKTVGGEENPPTSSQDGDVDLDSIFDFLSKVQADKHPLDDTLKDMENLVGEVDQELNAHQEINNQDYGKISHGRPVISQAVTTSITWLPPPATPPPSPSRVESPPLLPPPPHLLDEMENQQNDISYAKNVKIPQVQQQINGIIVEEKDPLVRRPKEPIYETIPAALKRLHREPNYISGPPPEGPPPAPPEDDATARFPPPPSAAELNQSLIENRRTPETLQEPRQERQRDRHQRPNIVTQKRVAPSPKTNSAAGGYRNPGEDLARLERRKQRVEKKLTELEEKEKLEKLDLKEGEPNHFEMIEFAEKFFNSHEKSPEGTIMSTLKKRSSSSSSIEYLPKYELITFTKTSSIPTSHIHLNDPENINIACNIFRDLCKYSRGEMKSDQESAVIQNIIEYGIEREELRNEIYVQCVRQVTNNPSVESLERIWLLLCLCIVAFHPGKNLYKYLYSFFQKSNNLEGKLSQYVQWCIENCKNSKGTPRKLPPSLVEIAAMKKLGTIVCRLFFLDGRTKAIDVHPRDTAADAIKKLADRLSLSSLDGWAIFVSGSDGEKHVKSHEYLYDIISSWEKKQNKSSSGTYGTIGKKNQSSTATDNRFVFRKRLFRNPREIPSDPIEVNLLYAQAVHSVVRCDDYPINEKVALQLAGLQAQVSLGDPQPGKTEFYADVHSYLPERIVQTQKATDWIGILAKAHQQYGTGKADILAKVWYLTCVMQFPLYGTTMYNVSYRGYWSYGNSLILGVNCDGIAMIKPHDKIIINEYQYCEIESIFLDPSDNFITFNLLRTLPDAHRCFVFETKEKEEIGCLIASYSPSLASWIRDVDCTKKVKQITNEDRVRLYYNIVHTRRQIIDNDLLRKPLDPGGNFIVSTLRRFNKQKLDRLRQDYGESAETYKGFHHSFWAFSKMPLSQSLLKVDDPALEEQMLHISQLIFTYSGLNPQGEIKITSDDEQLGVIQNLLEQCMKNNNLLNETYLQLLKQTNDHPDANSRVNMRHWSLLTLFCSVIPPTDRLVRKYLRAHLQRCAIDYITEEGKYSRFAEKSLLKALNNRRRQWPPSKQEILCTMNRRPIYARFHFMDGQFHSLEFDSSATANDVLELIQQKIGLKDGAKGYAIYEMLSATERCVGKEEVLADVMSRWERYRQATTPASGAPHSYHIFLFKKHLLLESWIDLTDPVEKELLYFQVLYSLRADKFPVTHTEAVMLCALRAQIELGNFTGVVMDYSEVIEHTLSPRLLTAVTHEAVAMQHQSLFNMDPQAAKESFLTLIKSFPLHRATIFDVTQSFTSNWPKVLWLALDEAGVHLLEHRSRNVLCTYEYNYILNYSASITALMIITGSKRKQSKVILNTTQAFMIATLIKDYSEVVLKIEGHKSRGFSGPPFGDSRPYSVMDSSTTSLGNFISQASNQGEKPPNGDQECRQHQRRASSRQHTLGIVSRPPTLVEEMASQ